jgi:hydrogenase nickel incorporation protein HypA/HybF
LHELSICQSMIRIVDATMKDHPGATLRRIYIDVGRASTVEPLLLRDAFESASTGGPYEGTELVINEIPFVGRCRACDKDFGYKEFALGCPNCGSTNIEIESGLELNIKEIEVDD